MRILFAGTPAFAASHLEMLIDAGRPIAGVISQPDKPGKRGKNPLPTPVKLAAESRGIPVLQPARLKVTDIDPFDPDLLIVVAYGQILRADVLSRPTHGCVNVHASLLPRWRGAAPIQRAILAGDQETGVCTMAMDEGLDTGAVYARAHVPIDAADTAATLADKLALAGGHALIDTIDAIEHGSATPIPQASEGVTYAAKVSKEEAQIDFSGTAAGIDRAIRAFNPDPIAFAWLGERRIRIWQAHIADGAGKPGTILHADKRGIEVACGQGSIVFTRLQLPVGKGTVMTAADVLNARREEFAPGKMFGQS